MGKNTKLSHTQDETAVCANQSLRGKQGKHVFCAGTVTGAYRRLALLSSLTYMKSPLAY